MIERLAFVERAQAEAGKLLALAQRRGFEPVVARGLVLLKADVSGLPLPDDAFAWASGGQFSDHDYFPPVLTSRQFLDRFGADIRRGAKNWGIKV